MKNPMFFFVELLRQPTWIPIWVFFLMAVNLAGIGFWDEPLAKMIVGTFMGSAMMMMALYSWFGFTRILGLGHVLWIPLLIYVLIQLPAFEGPFRAYLITLCVSISISLVFDIMDVWKYFRARGEV